MIIMVLQILVLMLILLVLPVLVGSLFSGVEQRGVNLPLRWVSGQICLWAGFQAVCVPLILMPRDKSFHSVVKLYAVFAAAMLLFALGVGIKRCVRTRAVGKASAAVRNDGVALLLWGLVICLLLLQLVLAAVLAYEEGDDAFYVAISVITSKSGTMYQVLPYTGGIGGTGLDLRHGLAPFPIWIAFLSRVSGMHAATVAQIVLPVTLIGMAYTIYYMIGRHLFAESRRGLPLFMLFLELLVIFGGQSLYTAENFLLVRTAQGKAVLACIIIPFLFFMMLLLFEKLQKQESTGPAFWILLAMVMTAGCLCSTQGTLLTCMLLGVGSLCGAVSYRRGRILFPAAACCVFPAVMAVLYLLLR